MGLFSAMGTGALGMITTSTRFDTISENIANAGTAAYKKRSAPFATLVTSHTGLGPLFHQGAIAKPRMEVDRQGALTKGTSPSDVAISGRGFFVVAENPDGIGRDGYMYTRAGAFRSAIDPADESRKLLRNAAGTYLMAWPTDRDGQLESGETLQDLEVVNTLRVSAIAEATTKLHSRFNLPAEAAYGPVRLAADNELTIDLQQLLNPADAGWAADISSLAGAGLRAWLLDPARPPADVSGAPAAAAVANAVDNAVQAWINDPARRDVHIGGVGDLALARLAGAPAAIGQAAEAAAQAAIAAGEEVEQVTEAAAQAAQAAIIALPGYTGPAPDELEAELRDAVQPVITSPALADLGLVRRNINAIEAAAEAAAQAATAVPGANNANVLQAAANQAQVTIAALVGLNGPVAPGLGAALQANAGRFSFTAREDDTHFALRQAMVVFNRASPLHLSGQFGRGGQFIIRANDAVDGNPLAIPDGLVAGNPAIFDFDRSFSRSYASSMVVYDENGNGHAVEIAWSRRADGDNLWEARIGEARLGDPPPAGADSGVTGVTEFFSYDAGAPEANGARFYVRVGGALVATQTLFFKFDGQGRLQEVRETAQGAAAEIRGEAANNDIPPKIVQIALGPVQLGGEGVQAAPAVQGAEPFDDKFPALSDEFPRSPGIAFDWLVGWPNGINPPEQAGNGFDGVTQLDSGMSEPDIKQYQTTQDGFRRGNVENVQFDTSGMVYATYDNGRQRPIYQAPIATFINPNGLTPKTGNLFLESADSGNVKLQAGGKDGAGHVLGHRIESANVNIANEFSDMIITQQAFTASSKVVTTSDRMLETLVVILR